MMRDLPMDLRPRKRMLYAGPSALSTAELLAIILRMGIKGENVIRMAERLLKEFGGIAGLAQAKLDELCQVHGLGEAKATQIKALELGKRLQVASPQDRPQVRSPVDVGNGVAPAGAVARCFVGHNKIMTHGYPFFLECRLNGSASCSDLPHCPKVDPTKKAKWLSFPNGAQLDLMLMIDPFLDRKGSISL